MKPEEERILDTALEELLGRVRPPDLTQRVLARLGHAGPETASASPQETVPQATQVQAPAASPGQVAEPVAEPVGRLGQRGAPARFGHRAWALVAIACASVLAFLVLGTLWQDGNQDRQQHMVQRHEETKPGGRKQGEKPKPPSGTQAQGNASSPESPSERPAGQGGSVVPDRSHAGAMGQEGRTDQAEPPQPPSQPRLARRFPPLVAPPVQRRPGAASPPGNDVPPRGGSPRVNDADVVAMIDQLIQRRWQEERVPVAAVASESTWCRRVYLDLLGRLPTVEELRQFVQMSGSLREKKRRLVQQLLYGEGYREQWAANWAGVWTVWLIGRTDGPLGRRVFREGLEEYLYQALLEGKSYDRLCTELLTATGSNRPGQADYSGAVNFLLKHLDEKGVAATAQTARVFLGTQVQCTQCHNHPFNQWKQSQFWGLNAFFRQARVKRGPAPGVYRLVDEDFPGEGAQPNWEQAEIYYELRNGLLKVAYPTFLDGRRINPAGRVELVNRRRELARLVVSSPLFSQAVVNRLWATFLGYGFTRPVDDLGPHNLPSHPELLDQLGRAFAAAGYDLRRLMGWIVLSRPYGLSSRVPRGSFDDPTTGQPPLFSRFYLRQMRPEQLYDSLSLLAGGEPSRFHRSGYGRQRQSWVQRFMFDLNTDENTEATLWETSLTQTLMMWNGPVVEQVVDPRHSRLVKQLVQRSDVRTRDRVVYLFQATLSRPPSRAELQMALHALRQYGPRRQEAAWSDLTWALINSAEFLMIR